MDIGTWDGRDDGGIVHSDGSVYDHLQQNLARNSKKNFQVLFCKACVTQAQFSLGECEYNFAIIL
jgi:hypothetical protein